MPTNIIIGGRHFDLDDADQLVMTLLDSKNGKLMTWEAKVPNGVDLEQVSSGGPGSTPVWKISFVPKDMKITEKEL